MARFISVLSGLLLLSVSPFASAGTVEGNWSAVPIFPQAPLELKLGTFGNGPNPDALAVILWNDGDNNRLDAVRIPIRFSVRSRSYRIAS